MNENEIVILQQTYCNLSWKVLFLKKEMVEKESEVWL